MKYLKVEDKIVLEVGAVRGDAENFSCTFM